MISQLLYRRLLKSQDRTWLEITPPANIAKTPDATEQLFSVVHGMYGTRKLSDKILGRLPVLSFEIVSTKKDGIRYLILVESSYSDAIQKAIMAYIPEAKVRECNIELPSADRVLEFRQKGHYVLPLTLVSAMDQHDPLAYVTNAMSNLAADESISVQLIVSPIKLREARRLSRRIMSNEDILSGVGNKGFAVMNGISNALNSVLWGAVDMTSEVYHGTTSGVYTTYADDDDRKFKAQVNKRQRPARTLSAFELELMESMHTKVTQSLFQVSLRVMVSGSRSKIHLRTLRSAFEAYSVPLYQSLKVKAKLPFDASRWKRMADKRLPVLFRKDSLILSASELSSLYHFPSSHISRTDNLVTSLSKTLPAPVSLKSGSDLAVVIGENHHHGTNTLIGLSDAERERHVYIIGGTGNGKTTMLLYSIVQDIKNGKGVAVLDPHGDLAETILQHIPEDRINDVIYMNPDDLSHPIGMNLLEIPPDLEGDDLLREKDLITESVISVMRKIFSEDDSGGHRIEYILRNAIQTALTLEDPTLFTIFDLLNDPKYRRDIVKNLDDEYLRNFWKNELGKAGDYQKVKMAAGITAKIGRFLFSASARRVLEQKKSTIDFDDTIDSGKILICNLSKGMLGEDTSTLFGTTILAKLQLASLRRARLNSSERKPFYLYVDEFQNFATMSFVQMLSEARKYKLFLTMAEQSTSQQDQQRLVDIILANVGTVVCFRSGSPADERLVLPLFTPYIEQGEIANLPAYSFYARIAAVHSQEPMSGVTLLLNDVGSKQIAEKVILSSRSNNATTFEHKKALKASQIHPAENKKFTKKAVSTKTSVIKNKRSVRINDSEPLS